MSVSSPFGPDRDDPDRDGPDRVIVAVGALVLAALVARLVGLGGRPAHFDEARVAYWTFEYHRTGAVHYRYIIHGPLVQHVVRPLFALLGPTDLAARLPIALAGAALPAVALLLRDRGDGDATGVDPPRGLSGVETLALAGFLAVNPILLYYSRFFRSTLLVAGFALVSFACLVRLAADRRPRYLYGAAVALALAFGAKENAVVYVLCWLGAAGLLADYALHRPRGYDSGVDRLRALAIDLRGRARGASGPWLLHAGGAVVAFLFVALFVYAPRNPDGVGLWSTVVAPWRAPELLSATVEDVRVGYGYWFGGTTEPGCNESDVISGYVCYLRSFVDSLGEYAAPLSALAVVGFVHERYVRAKPRGFVIAAGYWGFVSVLGYPLGTDVWGAWIVVNAVVALAIPAAVGTGALWRVALDAIADRDVASAGLVAAMLLVGAGWSGVAVVEDVYGTPAADDNDLVQYAQPSADLGTVIPLVGAAGADGTAGDVDVLVYGEGLVDGDAEAPRRPACMKWFETLPLPWYLEAAGADTTCATGEAAFASAMESTPPIVVARETEGGVVDGRLREAGYERTSFDLRTGTRTVAVYYDPALAGSAAPTASAAVDARAPS
jgi:uncharacterized protein (TIGR03663 family)